MDVSGCIWIDLKLFVDGSSSFPMFNIYWYVCVSESIYKSSGKGIRCYDEDASYFIIEKDFY